jgi:hypothetical protein
MNLIRRRRRRRCTFGEDVDAVRELAEVVEHPTTSAPRRSGPSKSRLLTDDPLNSYANYVLYMVQRGGAHYPQIWSAPDQGVAGDGLGPRDQEIRNSNTMEYNTTQKRKEKCTPVVFLLSSSEQV